MPNSWLSGVLDPAQIVMVNRKHLKITNFIIPNNFGFNNITKNSIPGAPLGHAQHLAVRGAGPHPDGHGQPETPYNI